MRDPVSICLRTWRRLGVDREEREQMAVELRTDLEQAHLDGLPDSAVLGVGGADVLAREWAEARGVVRTRRRLLSTVAAVLLGAAPGAAFILFIEFGLVDSPAIADIVYGPGAGARHHLVTLPVAVVLVLLTVGALMSLAGALGLTAWRLGSAGDPAQRRTVAVLLMVLPPAAALGVGAAVAFGSTSDFSYARRVVLAEVLVVAFALAGAALVARLVALRPGAQTASEHPSRWAKSDFT